MIESSVDRFRARRYTARMLRPRMLLRAAAAGILFSLPFARELLEPIERRAGDLLQRLATDAPGDSRVTILRLPAPRGPDGTLDGAALAHSLQDLIGGQLGARLFALPVEAAASQPLARLLFELGRVVLPLAPSPAREGVPLARAGIEVYGDPDLAAIRDGSRGAVAASLPPGPLFGAADRFGIDALPADSDGAVRSIPLAFPLESGGAAPSLPVAVAMEALGETSLTFAAGGRRLDYFGAREIPLDRARLRLRFHRGTFAPPDRPETIAPRDRVLLVAVDGSALDRTVDTPLGAMSALEVTAIAIDDLLGGGVLAVPHPAIAALIVLGLALAAAHLRGTRRRALWLAALPVAWLALASLALVLGFCLEVVRPLLAAAGALAAVQVRGRST